MCLPVSSRTLSVLNPVMDFTGKDVLSYDILCDYKSTFCMLIAQKMMEVLATTDAL